VAGEEVVFPFVGLVILVSPPVGFRFFPRGCTFPPFPLLPPAQFLGGGGTPLTYTWQVGFLKVTFPGRCSIVFLSGLTGRSVGGWPTVCRSPAGR